jgi:glucose/mannose-6-phosphate isomerase
VIDLDDPAAVRAADPSGILDAVMALGDQCRRGYSIGIRAENLPDASGVTSVVFCGMGGSGIGGDAVRALYRDRVGVPIEVVKDVALPEHCSPSSLVICSSFSGNTGETLSCFAQALDRGCRVVAVCSDGALRDRGEAAGVAVLGIPGDPPAPRTALGLLLGATVGALEAMGVVPALREEMASAASATNLMAAVVAPTSPENENHAKRIAREIGDRMPVVWGAEGLGAVAATRWKTEFQENAKVPAFSASSPELDHNEIVPWGERGTTQRGLFKLIALRHEGEHPDVDLSVSEQIASEGDGLEAIEVWGEGDSPLARFLSLVVVGSATSVYLGLLHGVDPAPIPAIDRLKRERASRQS